MNLQQQREAVRRRRLVSRGTALDRQRHRDEIRLGLVPLRISLAPALAPAHGSPAAPDDPDITRLVRGAILATMAGLIAHFHAPLLTAMQSVFGG